MHERYNGHDQVHNADGSGMEISNIGHSIIHSPHRDIHLNNIHHCPSSSKNLLSVHRIALDNHVFLEFHPFFFLIKDQVTKQILYRGRCVDGLYPLIPKVSRFNKQVCSAIRLSLERWHARLGHPSFSIVKQILSKNNLQLLESIILKQCVILAKELKVISCNIMSQLVCLLNLYSSYSLMYGVLLHFLLVDMLIMLDSSMTFVNIRGYTFLRKDVMCSKFSKTFKHLLKDNSIAKSSLFNPTGVVSMKN